MSFLSNCSSKFNWLSVLLASGAILVTPAISAQEASKAEKPQVQGSAKTPLPPQAANSGGGGMKLPVVKKPPPHKIVTITIPHTETNKNCQTSGCLSDAVVDSFVAFADEVKEYTEEDLRQVREHKVRKRSANGKTVEFTQKIAYSDTLRPLDFTSGNSAVDELSWHKSGRVVDLYSEPELKWLKTYDRQKNGSLYFRLYLPLKASLAAGEAKSNTPDGGSNNITDGGIVKISKKTNDTPYKKFLKSFSKGDTKLFYGGNPYPDYQTRIFVDVTAIAEKHGWTRIPAHSDWNTGNGKAVEWWHYENRGTLKTVVEAFQEIYPADRVLEGLTTLATTTKRCESCRAFIGRISKLGGPASNVICIKSPCVDPKDPCASLKADRSKLQGQLAEEMAKEQALGSQLKAVQEERDNLAKALQAAIEHQKIDGCRVYKCNDDDVCIGLSDTSTDPDKPEGILFLSGSHKLNPKAKENLGKIGDILQNVVIPKFPQRRFLVAGHTDKRRGPRDNWDLSASRSVTVVKFLISKGLSPKLFGAAGFGEYWPIDDRETPAAYAKNRRVEINIRPDLSRIFRQITTAPLIQQNK